MSETRIDELRRRLEREPGSLLFAQLAEELRRRGHWAEAVEVARTGLRLHPSYPSGRLTLGRALLDAGDARGAQQEFGEVVKQTPDHPVARRLLGQALDCREDWAGALEQYAAALRLNPDDRELRTAIRNLGLRLAPLEDGPVAADESSAAAEPEGDGSAATVVAPGDGGGAMPEDAVAQPPEVADGDGAVPALESGGSTPFSSSTLAELYLRQGLTDRAVEVYRQLLEIEPSNERAKWRLAEIERSRGGESRDGEARRAALERTISSLEKLLLAMRRR